MAPQVAQKRMNLRECLNHKKTEHIQFKQVRSADTMLLESQAKKEAISKNVSAEDILKEMEISVEKRITPYAEYEYSEQINMKRKWLLGQLEDYSRNYQGLINQNKEYPTPWFYEMSQRMDKEQKEALEAVKQGKERKQEVLRIPCCPLEKVIECDRELLVGYRNKVEFTIGRVFKSVEEKGPLAVGFNQGSLSKGIMYVGRPDNAIIISEESKQAAKLIEAIVIKYNDKYGLGHYDKIDNAGFWRILLYRESKKTKEVMLSLIVSDPENVKMPETVVMPTAEQLKEIQMDVLTAFKAGDKFGPKQYEVKSVSMIYSNEMSGGYKEDDRFDLLSGESMHYTEEVAGFKFTVSPFAFFQVNINVFEKMLHEVQSFLGIDDKTILFDVCCGTGAIGICLS